MAVAGWCSTCGQYVYLNENWGCVNGHGWDQIGNWYDTDTGQPVIPNWLQAAPAGEATAQPAPEVAPDPIEAPAAPVADAPAQGSRLAVLADILQALQASGAYDAQYGTSSDITIASVPLDASWGVGKKKVEYSAVLKAVEGERTIYFWELLKERGSGMSFGSFESESYSTVGTRRFGSKSETVVTPGGTESWDWNYSTTRKMIENIAAEQGWKVKTVLRKKSAEW